MSDGDIITGCTLKCYYNMFSLRHNLRPIFISDTVFGQEVSLAQSNMSKVKYYNF